MGFSVTFGMESYFQTHISSNYTYLKWLLGKGWGFLGLFCLFLYLLVFCLHVCMYTSGVPGTYRSHKKASDLLALELQTFVSHRRGVRTKSSARVVTAPNH